ncbi:MAG: hypothetical protein VB862_13520, partial [Pirellulaceae bacterium]
MKLFQSGLLCFCSLSCLLVTLADSAQAQNSTNQDGSAELLVALQAPSRGVRTPSDEQRGASRSRSGGEEAKKKADSDKQPAAGSGNRSGSSRSGGDEAKKAGAEKQPAAASRSRSSSSRGEANANRGRETTRVLDVEGLKKRLDIAVKAGTITREQADERLAGYRKRLAQGRENQAREGQNRDASRSRSGSGRNESNANRSREADRAPDMEAVKKRLDVAVKEGIITREQADERLAGYRKRLAQGRENQAREGQS